MSFDDSISAGNKIIASALQSPNYAQGSSGWTINRDGSAEFQNVLVRGTITGSTIIGSTIIGGTIIGGDIQSTNFSNTAHTGFDLNATASTDAAGTPANTIQIYSAFQVGPTAGDHLTLNYTGGFAQINFYSGTTRETSFGAVFATADPVDGTWPILAIQSPTAGGNNPAIDLLPRLNSIQVNSQIIGVAGVNGGGVSISEGVGFTSAAMRAQYARSLGPFNTGAVANTFSFGAPQINLNLPPSGTLVVTVKATITAVVAGQTLFGDFEVVNNTQSTTPYGGSTNNGWSAAAAITPTGTSFMSTLVVGGSVGAQGGILGNPGDSMTVACGFAPSSAAAWQVSKVSITVVPSP